MYVFVRSLMHDDWSASCACITAVKWAQATKDLRWEESWDEEFAPEHRRRCVGISSERISHLIKTSAQLPGGLYATPRSFMQTSQYCFTQENQCKWGACFFLQESETVLAYVLLMTRCHAEWGSASRLPLKCITSL